MKSENKLSKGKSYFETNHKFERLIPSECSLTEAPRLSVKGSTLHGMNKSLLIWSFIT